MSDINGKVTGIQGRNVVDVEPNDGDTLIWSSADGYYHPGKISGGGGIQNSATFNSDGYWTCPEGVSFVNATLCGGGGGGGGGMYPAGGGGAAIEQSTWFAVTPGEQYFVEIGTGGTGGSWGYWHDGVTGKVQPGNGQHGGTTKVSLDNNVVTSAVGGGGAVGGKDGIYYLGANTNPSYGFGGNNFPSYASATLTVFMNNPIVGGGGNGAADEFISAYSGNLNINGLYVGGAGGLSASGSYYWAFGGGGGGAGPRGNGAAGGDGTTTVGGNGQNAGNNTGAGGGGGSGVVNNNTYHGGAGGNGGSGYAVLRW